VSLTLQESAALVGGHCWIERRLFERLGAWSQLADVPAAKVLLDRHAQHAAWRGEQWWDRLPILAPVDRDELVIAPSGWSQVLAGHRDVATTEALLALAYRVLLARLATRYSRHASQAGAVADGPVIRTLGHVEPDVRADWGQGERLMEDLLVDRATIDAVAATIAAAEAEFLV
jgi:hypothetical protein